MVVATLERPEVAPQTSAMSGVNRQRVIEVTPQVRAVDRMHGRLEQLGRLKHQTIETLQLEKPKVGEKAIEQYKDQLGTLTYELATNPTSLRVFLTLEAEHRQREQQGIYDEYI